MLYKMDMYGSMANRGSKIRNERNYIFEENDSINHTMKAMNNLLRLLILGLVLAACGQKSHDHAHMHDADAADTLADGGNSALGDEVMKVHDEVMPKLDDIYKLKEQLKNKIAETPAMADAKKKEIEAVILKLDSASEGMMVWMRHFDPMGDSLSVEQKREYLENEMEKVRKVREDIYEALSQGEAAAKN